MKHGEGASLTIIGNPDVNNIDDAIFILSKDITAISLSHRSPLTNLTYIYKSTYEGLSGLSFCIETSGLPIKFIAAKASTWS